MNNNQIEIEIKVDSTILVAGVDEAGRGPLAGDVITAAVILDPKRRIDGLADSKQLTGERREELYLEIVDKALSFAIARASVEEIDSLNILQASLLAMHRAVAALSLQPRFVYVDGNHCPKWRYSSQAVVRGDSLVPAISAASILAKVTRDREMRELDRQYPGYGMSKHKGYPTPEHLLALKKLGPCPIHRRSYRPVAELLLIDG